MIDRRGLCKLLNYGAVVSLLPCVASARQSATTDKDDSQLANLIGEAVLEAIQRYERNTGKQASTVVLHLTGKLPIDSPRDLPVPDPRSRDYTQLNQSHSMFSIKVEINPQKSH